MHSRKRQRTGEGSSSEKEEKHASLLAVIPVPVQKEIATYLSTTSLVFFGLTHKEGREILAHGLKEQLKREHPLRYQRLHDKGLSERELSLAIASTVKYFWVKQLRDYAGSVESRDYQDKSKLFFWAKNRDTTRLNENFSSGFFTRDWFLWDASTLERNFTVSIYSESFSSSSFRHALYQKVKSAILDNPATDSVLVCMEIKAQAIYAARLGQVAEMKVLFNKFKAKHEGPKVDVESFIKDLVMAAAENGHVSILKEIFENADWGMQNFLAPENVRAAMPMGLGFVNNFVPQQFLEVAVRSGQLEVIQYLDNVIKIVSSEDKNSEYKSNAYRLAFFNGNVAILKYLGAWKYKQSAADLGLQMIHAVRTNHLDKVEFLIEQGVNTDFMTSRIPVNHSLSSKERYEWFERLTKYHTMLYTFLPEDRVVHRELLFMIAVRHCYVEVLTELLKNKGDISLGADDLGIGGVMESLYCVFSNSTPPGRDFLKNGKAYPILQLLIQHGFAKEVTRNEKRFAEVCARAEAMMFYFFAGEPDWKVLVGTMLKAAGKYNCNLWPLVKLVDSHVPPGAIKNYLLSLPISSENNIQFKFYRAMMVLWVMSSATVKEEIERSKFASQKLKGEPLEGMFDSHSKALMPPEPVVSLGIGRP